MLTCKKILLYLEKRKGSFIHHKIQFMLSFLTASSNSLFQQSHGTGSSVSTDKKTVIIIFKNCFPASFWTVPCRTNKALPPTTQYSNLRKTDWEEKIHKSLKEFSVPLWLFLSSWLITGVIYRLSLCSETQTSLKRGESAVLCEHHQAVPIPVPNSVCSNCFHA